jgi:hypothetical protein
MNDPLGLSADDADGRVTVAVTAKVPVVEPAVNTGEDGVTPRFGSDALPAVVAVAVVAELGKVAVATVDGICQVTVAPSMGRALDKVVVPGAMQPSPRLSGDPNAVLAGALCPAPVVMITSDP